MEPTTISDSREAQGAKLIRRWSSAPAASGHGTAFELAAAHQVVGDHFRDIRGNWPLPSHLKERWRGRALSIPPVTISKAALSTLAQQQTANQSKNTFLIMA